MSVDLRVYEFGKLGTRRGHSSADAIPLQVIVNEDNSRDTADFIQKRLSAIKNQRSSGELEDLALVIG